MGLLDKLEQVEITADSRLPEDDLMFCETQQQAYDESCRALREIRQQWKKAIQAQRDLLGIGQDGSLPYFGSNYRFGITDLNRELEKFHSRFISELTQHFNEKYSVTISTDAIKEHLIPAEPDPYRCDMDTSKEYHRNLRALALHYEDVVDQMFIRNNWNVVLPNYDVSYVFVERLRDLERIKPGDFVLMTFNALCKYRRQIKKWLKIHSRKTCLVLDESDEICNPYSSRAKAVLSCFRRCQSKLLTTGTSTRNNISEFAPQMELLYNNSINMLSCCHTIYHYDKDGTATRETNPWYGQPIPAYRRGYTLFANSHLPEKITVFGVGQRTQDIYNADILRDTLAKTVITRTFEEVTGKDIKRIHQELIPFSAEEKAVWVQAVKEFHTMRQNYFTSTNNARKDAMLRIIQQITLLLRISAAPNTVSEYSGELPGKLRRTIQLTGNWAEEIVAIGVRHTVVLDAYAAALREAFPNRPLFIVTGATTTFAKRRALRQTLRESGNGILLCTQQSLPSSVNFEFVNKVIIPELHYNNSRMSQFYMRFIRFNSVDWKDIYFLTYAQSIESNLMQMILAKEKLNLFMKGDEADMDDIYERFGVDYDLTSLLLYRDIDEDGRFSIRWGEQEIA